MSRSTSAAGKVAGQHSLARMLLAVLVLAATFAGLPRHRPFDGQSAWGLNGAALHSALPLPLPTASGGQQQQQQQQQLRSRRAQQLEPQQAEQPQQPPLDLEASSPVHGRLVKAGPQAALAAIASGSGPCELSYWDACPGTQSWVQQRTAGTAPPFPSKWCATLYNDRLKIIYMKCTKTGGTALIRQFKICGYGKATADRCLKYVDVNNVTEVQHIVSKWQEYFVFAFSRNILARAISQYRYVSHYVEEGWPLPTWSEFCSDPFVFGDMVLTAQAAGQRCCSQTAEHQYVHVLPQAHCFTTAANEPALDWLGRVEQFEEDVAELFHLLNARPGMPQLPMEPQRRTNIALPARCTPRRRSRLLLGGGDDDSGSGSGHSSGDSSKSGSGGSVGLTFQLHNSTFVPCDDLDYFRGPHAHCYNDLMRFFNEDVTFLHGRQQ